MLPISVCYHYHRFWAVYWRREHLIPWCCKQQSSDYIWIGPELIYSFISSSCFSFSQCHLIAILLKVYFSYSISVPMWTLTALVGFFGGCLWVIFAYHSEIFFGFWVDQFLVSLYNFWLFYFLLPFFQFFYSIGNWIYE